MINYNVTYGYEVLIIIGIFIALVCWLVRFLFKKM